MVDLKVFNWYCNGQLTAVVTADYTQKTVEVKNLVNDSYYLPFAPDIKPSFTQWQAVLTSHCPSKNNAFIDQFLESIGLDHYDVLEIIKKTNGKAYHSPCTIELMEG